MMMEAIAALFAVINRSERNRSSYFKRADVLKPRLVLRHCDKRAYGNAPLLAPRASAD
jgi:hypothetical protein